VCHFLFSSSLLLLTENKPFIMFAATRVSAFAAKRAFSTSAANLSKVAVLGAAGGIGQPLSLLLKENPHVTHLSLYDIVNTPGVAADLR
jgi:malate dehydrogenase